MKKVGVNIVNDIRHVTAITQGTAYHVYYEHSGGSLIATWAIWESSNGRL
jgi:hypothetical protein